MASVSGAADQSTVADRSTVADQSSGGTRSTGAGLSTVANTVAGSSIADRSTFASKRPPTGQELIAAGMGGYRFDANGNLVHPAGAPLGAVA